jgi:hypothetical protein
MTVESHLQRRSRAGDGRNKVELIEGKGGDVVEVIDGGMGVLVDSPVVVICEAGGARRGNGERVRTTGSVLVWKLCGSFP